MQPISRRRALQLGGLGVGSAAVGGAGLTWRASSWFAPEPGTALREPRTLRSEGGSLRVELQAARGETSIGGRQATVLGYNGGLPGPTLRVRPGDRLQVRLSSRLDEATNLHVHGLHVSPSGNGDNAFVSVPPGEFFDYDYQLPADHRPGTYWYHPHRHGLVAEQVFGGLYGAIIVEDPAPLPITRERVLVISDITLDASGWVQEPSAMARMMGREGNLVLVNGQVQPRLSAHPGERERWRIVNACTSRYLRLRLDGQHLQLLGIDSGRFPRPFDVDEVVLATGNRADLLVTATQGTSSLEMLPVDRGRIDAMMGRAAAPSRRAGSLATLRIIGSTVPDLPAVTTQPDPRDLRTIAPAARRRLTFDMGMGGMGMGGMGNGGMRFTIDGKGFDPDRVDQAVQVGTVEEWTVTNTSPMDHPLHLHVWPMQLIERGGRPIQAATWQDVVNVPARGDVKVRVAFDTFAGRTVYHCHILDHEDNGMMAVLEAR